MADKSSLAALAQEYREQADALSLLIKARTGRLKECFGDIRSTSGITKELETLYAMRKEVIQTAHKLENYYDTEVLA